MMMSNTSQGNTATEKVYVTHVQGNSNIIDVQVDSLDHRYIEAFKSAINHCLFGNQKKLILNLKTVNFMDSAGLGIILYGYRACKQAGGEFVVCEASGYVSKLFGLTGVSKAIQVHSTLEEAFKV